MKVEITAAGIRLPATAKSAISRHAYFELSRFGDKLKRITIRLSKETTPPLDLDAGCLVIIEWPILGLLEAETRHSDPVQAACNGLTQIRRRLSRHLNSSDWHRNGPEKPLR